MNRQTISVALCTYNGARYLTEQLASIAAQTRLPDDVVICDDGSRDASVSIARAFAERSPFEVQVHVNPQNVGFVANFAGAISRCSGDLTALSDQDDVWRYDKLERLEQALDQAPGAAAAFSNATLIDGDSRPLPGSLWEAVGFDAGRQASFAAEPLRELLRRNVVTGGALLLRSSYLPLLLPFPGSAPHDAWIALVLSIQSRLIALEAPLMSYRLHDSNQIGASGPGTLRSRLSVDGQRRNLSDLGRLIATAEHLRERMRRHAPGFRSSADDQMLDEFVRHATARCSYPRNRLARLPPILAEWRAGRYRSFAFRGAQTIIRDLLVAAAAPSQ